MRLGKRTLNRFLRDREGNMSIEFVMWLPVMVGFLCLCCDATMLFFKQQLLYDVARDASRQVSLGAKTPTEAELALALVVKEEGSKVKVAVDGEYVTSTIAVPFETVLIFSGVFAHDALLSASVTMWIEPDDAA